MRKTLIEYITQRVFLIKQGIPLIINGIFSDYVYSNSSEGISLSVYNRKNKTLKTRKNISTKLAIREAIGLTWFFSFARGFAV